METKSKTCCFIGHRKIIDKEKTIPRLRALLRDLIEGKHVDTFLFGSVSEFNDICHDVTTEFKKEYSNIRRICYVCKSEWACFEKERLERERGFNEFFNSPIVLRGYEEEHKLKKIFKAGKASYIERNKAMINDSNYCVFYYCDKYNPEGNGRSGTRIAYEYAQSVAKRNGSLLEIVDIYS